MLEAGRNLVDVLASRWSMKTRSWKRMSRESSGEKETKEEIRYWKYSAYSPEYTYSGIHSPLKK